MDVKAGARIVALAWLCAIPTWAHGGDAAIEVRFRGCEPTGWCRFWFERAGDAGAALHRVLPDGITPRQRDDAVRDRLNALLSDMIHQHKRIELLNLRARDDGGLAATVTVTGVALMQDDTLRALLVREPTPVDPGDSPPQ